MHRYLIAVRIAPGTIRGLLIYAPEPGEACDVAEALAAIMSQHPCPVVSCRRLYD
jgi:hypothetical protein